MNDAIHGGSEDDHVRDQHRRGPDVVATGHAEIDEALAALAQLADKPVTEHVSTYDAIHHVVRTTLADAGRPEGPGTL